jgi:hypothetical protein
MVPDMYIAALPFPGRAAGKRLAITEDDRGITCESFIYSAPDVKIVLHLTDWCSYEPCSVLGS